MEPFVNVFFAIDKNQNDYITTSELHDYVRQNRLDSAMVTRWQTLFDPYNTGKISFEKFCEVLGLRPEQTRHLRREKVWASPEGLDSDIIVIFENMSLADQIRISREYKRLVSQIHTYDPRELTQLMKKWLDSTYGRTWHVAIVRGSFWITFSHSEHNSFHFRYKDDCVLVWRTGSDGAVQPLIY